MVLNFSSLIYTFEHDDPEQVMSVIIVTQQVHDRVFVVNILHILVLRQSNSAKLVSTKFRKKWSR